MNLNAGESVFVSAEALLGTVTNSPTFAYDVAYQVGGGGVNAAPDTQYGYSFGMPTGSEGIGYVFSCIFTAPSTGNYNIGFGVCNYGSVALNNNNGSNVSVIVLS